MIEQIRATLRLEAQAILDLIPTVNHEFEKALELIHLCQGKIIFSGVGKSGIVSQKIAATFNSTGTSAVFVHPTDALHGDIGILSPLDLMIVLGKSGETPELNQFLLAAKGLGLKIIAITANSDSTLARLSHVVLKTPISHEACPHDLAPTSSTTVAMALGDALALSVMKLKNFQSQDFAKLHPGGALGRKLTLSIKDVMIPKSKCAILDPKKANMTQVLETLDTTSHGIVLFSEDSQTLLGILTDGDIRRLVLSTLAKLSSRSGLSGASNPVGHIGTESPDTKLLNLEPMKVMNLKPLSVLDTLCAYEALQLMENRPKALNVLVVLNQEQKIAGIVRTHELF